MSETVSDRDLEKAALRGEPSYVWRSGQERRLAMIVEAAGEGLHGLVLENGCGVGMYVQHLAALGGRVIGLEYDFERAALARQSSPEIVTAAGEALPFPDNSFDLALSHEVLEHVQDDREAVIEMVRVLRTGGRAVIFVPNRGYPFETHGIYWRGHYHFGNIPLVNYLPRRRRDRLAPHVPIYFLQSYYGSTLTLWVGSHVCTCQKVRSLPVPPGCGKPAGRCQSGATRYFHTWPTGSFECQRRP